MLVIDRRMMDFMVGLDSEAGDLVEGSHLYTHGAARQRHSAPRTEESRLGRDREL